MVQPVSYTHLDVYKRQAIKRVILITLNVNFIVNCNNNYVNFKCLIVLCLKIKKKEILKMSHVFYDVTLYNIGRSRSLT